MKLNKDTGATILGLLIAGATAAQPVLTGVAGESLHQGDWISLVTAVGFAVWGWLTNRAK